jgi:hypothetical protein
MPGLNSRIFVLVAAMFAVSIRHSGVGAKPGLHRFISEWMVAYPSVTKYY